MTNQENQNREDRAMRSLQEELNRMAAETPEMPESFRQGWREAIRQEVKTKEAERLFEKSEPQEEAERQPAQNEEPKKGTSKVVEMKPARGFSAKWRRGLSIAAVAAFLLGGTLLGQERASLTQIPQSETVSAAMDRTSEESAAEETGNVPDFSSLESGREVADATQMPVATSMPTMEVEGEASETAIFTATMYESEEDAEMEEAASDAAMPAAAAYKSAEDEVTEGVVSETAVPVAMARAPEEAEEMVESRAADEALTMDEASMDSPEKEEPEKAEAEAEANENAEYAEQRRSASPLRVTGWILIGLSLVCLILLFTFRK